ncbi:MAG: hypothetical protein AAGH15_26450 [Myxococcota bacterium]
MPRALHRRRCRRPTVPVLIAGLLLAVPVAAQEAPPAPSTPPAPAPADDANPFNTAPPAPVPPPPDSYEPSPTPAPAPGPTRYVTPPLQPPPRVTLLSLDDLDATLVADARRHVRTTRILLPIGLLTIASMSGVFIWASRCEGDAEDCPRETNVVQGSLALARVPTLAASVTLLVAHKRLRAAGLSVPGIGRARAAVAHAAIPLPLVGIASWTLVLRHRRVLQRVLRQLDEGERLPGNRPVAW